MFIHLKRGEKLYVNGAVLRIDRRASLEFLNDVTFLLENHVMQPEQATTPLKQLYFVAQSMLMDPTNAAVTAEVYKHLSHRAQSVAAAREIRDTLELADGKVREGRYFDALKLLRACFSTETEQSMPGAHGEAA